MTREEAIKYAEDRLTKGLYRLDLGYLNRGLYQITAREVDFMRVAIAALREQETVTDSHQFETVTICHGLNGWISVKERLPTRADANPNESVLAIAKDDGFARAWIWDIVERYYGEFTYWMPFPEPPEVEG